MDNRNPTSNATAPVLGSTGCCGGAHHAKPQAEAEIRPTQAEKAKSGCGCGSKSTASDASSVQAPE